MCNSVRGLVVIVGMIFSLLFSALVAAKDNGWTQYKQRFLLPEGRVIDTANNNVSHTEGQGYAMLLAVFNNDQPTFERMWQWTRNTLYRKDIGLFSWRYDPSKANPVVDKNNATDGDTIIAWALLEGGKKWRSPDYLRISTQIQQALIKNTVMQYGNYTVALPGVSGFVKSDLVNLNASYFLFPAWKAFYQQHGEPVWQTLSNDAIELIGKMNFGQPGVPTDWASLTKDGRLSPAKGWPSRFGFDAVRTPLYLSWYQADSPALQPFINLWGRYDPKATPAWIDVLTGEHASFNLSPGVASIRDLVSGQGSRISNTLEPQEDYYSASLHLLAYWVQHNR